MLGKNVSPRIQKLENDFIRNGGCFKEYKIEDLFRNLKVSLKLSKLDISEEFTFPVYSSDTSNGGIYGYSNFAEFIVDDENESYLIFGDHTRTFNIARQSFAVMDNVKVLKPLLKYWSDESLLYVATIWKKQIPNYGYSRHWKYAKSCLLKLPSYNDELAFDYMESYIRELEQERIRELDAYLRATGLNDYELTLDEYKLEENFFKSGGRFKKFKIGELFDIHPTKSYGYTNTKLFDSIGNTPVVVNSSKNNGIGGRVKLAPTEKANTITFSDTTTAESIFVQDEMFIGYSHVQGLYPYKDEWSKRSLMYFATLFRKNAIQMKFDYANKFNRSKASDMFVLLPVNNLDQVAFDFMEHYIKVVEKICIRSVVEWKERVIETTKTMVN